MRKFFVSLLTVFFVVLASSALSLSHAGWIKFQPGSYLMSKEWEGIQRKYKVFIPESYDGTKPVDLVLVLHGIGGNLIFAEDVSQMVEYAKKYGFIVVFPQGTPLDWNYPDYCGWNDGAIKSNDVDDVGFIAKLIEDLQLTLNIRSVFMAGMSQGAFMTYRFASERPGMVDAIGIVAASIGSRETKDSPAFVIKSPGLRVPVISLNGVLDTLVSYDGNKTEIYGKSYRFLPIWDAMQFWAKANDCNPEPEVEYVSENVIRYTFTDKKGRQSIFEIKDDWTNSSVIFYAVLDGEHYWFGMPRSIAEKYQCPWIPPEEEELNSTEKIIEFFATHLAEDPQIIEGEQVYDYTYPTFRIKIQDPEKVMSGIEDVRIYQDDKLIDIVPLFQREFSIYNLAALKTGDVLCKVINENGKETNMFRLYYQDPDAQDMIIENAGVSYSYNPPAVWATGSGFIQGMTANIYQNGQLIGETTVFTSVDNAVTSFQLPAETEGLIGIEFVFGDLVSNRFYLNF